MMNLMQIRIVARAFYAYHIFTCISVCFAKFSSILCRRGGGGVKDRICNVQDVCFDRNQREWIYYEDPDQPSWMEPTDAGTVPIHDIIDLVELRSEEEPHHFPFRLSYRYEPLPTAGAITSNSSVHVLFESFWAENYGHALGDDILPIYVLMKEFDVVTRDVQVLMASWENTKLVKSQGLESPDSVRGKKNLDFLSSLISDHTLVDMSKDEPWNILKSSSQPTYVCVSKLLVGHARLGYMSDKGRTWDSLISTMISSAATKDIMVKKASRHFLFDHLVLIIEKLGRRKIINHENLVRHISKSFKVKVISINPEKLSYFEQIALAQQATVTITPCGGISFFTSFMRPYTVSIYMGYWDSKKKKSQIMDAWNWLPLHIDIYYDVEFKEISILPPPSFWENPSPKDYKNNGAVTVNLEKMQNLVASALFMSNISLASNTLSGQYNNIKNKKRLRHRNRRPILTSLEQT